jgi:protein phosphatase
MSKCHYACVTDPGRVHSTNDDRWFADDALGMFLIADGMAVSEPAQLVVDVLPDIIRHRLGHSADLKTGTSADLVCSAIRAVSERILAAALDEPGVPWLGLGATIALAVVRWPDALLAHLGDSRIYLARGGRLELMTRDHSWTEDLIRQAKLVREQVDPRAFNGGPTRFAGMVEEAVADTRLLHLQAGDRLLLCSDGLNSMLDDSAIERVLNAHAEPESACRALIDAANAAGGKDNVTVLVVSACGAGSAPTGRC